MVVSKEEKLDRILELIEDYVRDSDQSWKAGEDWVRYAGSYFDTKEYTEAVKT